MRRRSLLGLAVAVPLLAACDAPAGIGPPPAPVPLRAHTRWTGRPDGPMPARGDEGLPFTVHATAGPPSITGGALDGNLPERPSAAAYVMQSLDTKVQLIGALFGFGPGGADGSLALIAWVPGRGLTAPFHVAITPDRWIASVAEGDRLVELGSGALGDVLAQDGRPYRAEIRIDGPTVALTLPDGTVERVSGPEVERLPGSIPCWEFYRNAPGGAPVLFYETWAG